MSRTIVVVTCEKDKYEFELLCRSMQKFLTPSRVIIVCNEPDCTNWIDWYKKSCEPVLKKHKVRLFKKHDFWQLDDESHLHPLQKEGWIDQQVIKLAVANYINTPEYICLDSKNFFLRPCNTYNIKQCAPVSSDWAGDWRHKWIRICCEELGVPYPGEHIKLIVNITPYIIKTKPARDLVEHFGGTKKFYRWFTEKSIIPEISPGEFFLYEIWLIKHGLRNPRDPSYIKGNNIAAVWGDVHHHRLKWELQDYIDNFQHHIEFYDLYMGGIHRSLYPYLTEDMYKKLLESIDLDDCIPLQPCPFNGLQRKPNFET